jgi:NADP-dependent 3-hydroxy acid dehydrogenase YdfG
MTSLRGKTALVVGASAGVGKATVKALVREGARVTAVARGAEGLAALREELGAEVETHRADASEPANAERLVRELRPDFLILCGGARPEMGPLDELGWESFSETWNNDTKSTFHFIKAALVTPLARGSTIVVLSSGAAINGSHFSGGYAGAKRMQWLLAGYAQQRSDALELGLRFLAVLPKQLVEGTAIGERASTTYGALSGKTGREFMQRFEVPLGPDKVADAILGALRGEVESGVTAIAVVGTGIERLS